MTRTFDIDHWYRSGPVVAGLPHAVQSVESEMIGSSPAFRGALALIDRMAAYDAPVLIEGETGTGKELAARAIHYRSRRRDRPFVPVNCASLPGTLIESELFGHRRGAFTDARDDQLGLVALADTGTLFLDEIDALSLRSQVTLLEHGVSGPASDRRPSHPARAASRSHG